MTRYEAINALVNGWRLSASKYALGEGIVAQVTCDTLMQAAQELEAALALPEDDSLTAKMREAGIDPDADTMHDVYMTVEQRAAFNRLCDDAMRYRALPKPPKGEV